MYATGSPVSVSPIDGPGVPGGGRRGTLSKGKGRAGWDGGLLSSEEPEEPEEQEEAEERKEGENEPLLSSSVDRLRVHRGEEEELGIRIERP